MSGESSGMRRHRLALVGLCAALGAVVAFAVFRELKVGAADSLAAGGGTFVGVGTLGLAVCMYLSVREDKT